jgi:hypothetical protein
MGLGGPVGGIITDRSVLISVSSLLFHCALQLRLALGLPCPDSILLCVVILDFVSFTLYDTGTLRPLISWHSPKC